MRERHGSVYRWALVAVLWGALAPGVASAQTDLQERTREAALATYIHGMTQEIAEAEFGQESVPALVDLLHDPSFPRRDNVVAVLGYLGGDESTTALLSFLEKPPADLRAAVEDRSALLAPQSLGQIASRGHRRALQSLLAMTAPDANGGMLSITAARGAQPVALRDDLVHMALRGLAYSGAPEARGRLDAIGQGRVRPARDGRGHGRSARNALELFDRLHGPVGPGAVPEAHGIPTDGAAAAEQGSADGDSDGAAPGFDSSHANVNNSRLDYANHVNVTNPMTDARLDDCLDSASLRMGKANFGGDVACCAGLQRKGSAGSWGTTNDGLDIIDNSTEVGTVLNHPSARFKVVRAINYCGGSGTNIIGCGWIGGNGVAVVRYGSEGSEGVLWAHEYGHNVGLQHNTGGGSYIMYGSLGSSNTGLTQAECDRYHTPVSGTAADLMNVGACTDGDVDDVHDVVDNCPGVPNNDQTDSDHDGVGDVCEGGCGNGVIDSGEECDATDLGGQSCSTRGYDGGALGCASDCTYDESDCSTCGNGIREPGEACDGTDLGGATCADQSCNGGTPVCSASCTVDYATCSDCPVCDNDGVCETDEDCSTCSNDCIAGAGASCGNGVCEAAEGEDCLTCAADCRGRQKGKPTNQYCCGAGGGTNPLSCSDARCDNGADWICTDGPVAPSCCGDLVCEGIETGFNCEIDCGPPPFCGDGICNGGEDSCSCENDCGLPPVTETACGDGVDDDCDGFADCSDSDCGSSPECVCLPKDASCVQSNDCCSGKCKGPGGNKTCK